VRAGDFGVESDIEKGWLDPKNGFVAKKNGDSAMNTFVKNDGCDDSACQPGEQRGPKGEVD
jgi:hypothetical protein